MYLFECKNNLATFTSKAAKNWEQKVLQRDRANPIIVKDLINLLTICLLENYFIFNDEIYLSKTGLPLVSLGLNLIYLWPI